MAVHEPHKVRIGLRHNIRQFLLLVVINAFVGGMIGMERAILPELAEQKFGMVSKMAILSFIVAFGISKAFTNYFTGKWANRYGRRNLLLLGWSFAFPIPILLIIAKSWSVVIIANVFLGIHQGLAWSSTVVMKIDLVGEKDRGFAMGINEFAGYLSVGIVAFLTGMVARHFGLTPYPFYLGILLSCLGFFLTLLFVEDTVKYVAIENKSYHQKSLKNIFWETSFTNKTLSAVTQSGLVNNLNDGMIWGLLPIFLSDLMFDYQEIGLLTALYPAVWGIGQLFTGRLADIYSKKYLLFGGMLIQGISIAILAYQHSPALIAISCIFLGIGTAMVYPTFLTVIAQTTSPIQRAESIGVFRLWRDLGYVLGAILSGIIADKFGVPTAIALVGVLTILSALILQGRME